ncbi:MAG: tRNA 2-thiouridine(34) synthase MnmA [Rhodospirillales bacterium]|nr:tRNA 2-thiouridine(34) synthase MnmA [Rhodospirillales bacterium]
MNTLGFDKSPADTRVVVAMSGGVDSSVTAALMAEQGYDVIGITLQLYDHGQAIQRKGACCAGQDIHDARRVADTLGIPHYVLDYENRFKEQVIKEFAASYLAGETPVPCIRCNQTVKFRDLMGRARELGADALVTGHYVRRVEGAGVFGAAQMHRARDDAKDQSYFLFATTPEQLNFLRFPLGDLEKAETRKHAERFHLAVADKPESQDICFVPNGSYAGIVEKLHPGAAEPGDIVDGDGNVIGRHDGIIHFTVGQRRGLGIAAPEPLYVLRVDPVTRRVVAGPKAALLKTRMRVHDINWLGDDAVPNDGQAVTVKVRSASEPVAAKILDFAQGRANVVFDEPQAGIAPGQACVFYDADRVLGGGWIQRDDA